MRPFFPRLVEPVAQRHTWLDEQGIDHQIVGTWPDIFGYGLPREPASPGIACSTTRWRSGRADNAQRFSWISSVPLTDAEAAAPSWSASIGVGAVGVIISSNIENINLGELPLDPFWRKAEALGATRPDPSRECRSPRRASESSRSPRSRTTPIDTTLGVGSLLMSGVMDRFPKLKLLWSHGGGTFPYLAGRFDVMHQRMDKAGQGDVAAKTPSAYATQMAYDSIVHAPKALRFLIDVVGIDNVLLGTDYSFPPADMEPLALLRLGRIVASRHCGDFRWQPTPPVLAPALTNQPSAVGPTLRGPELPTSWLCVIFPQYMQAAACAVSNCEIIPRKRSHCAPFSCWRRRHR